MTPTELHPVANTTADARRVRWRGTALVEPGDAGEVAFGVHYGETVQIIATRGLVGYVGAVRYTCKIVAVEVDGREGRDLPPRVSGEVRILVAYPAGVERVEFSLSCIEDEVRVADQWSWLPEVDRRIEKSIEGRRATAEGDDLGDDLVDDQVMAEGDVDEGAARVRKRLFDPPSVDEEPEA